MKKIIDTSLAPEGIYLVDTFEVPAAARADFEAAMLRNRAFIRTLEGFCGDVVLVRKHGETFDVATIAAWESAAAVAKAKERVEAYYAEIGFDMRASIAKWGVTLERTLCEAPPALQ